MADARDLLRALAVEDRRGAVFCAALCAASVAHLVPVGERRPWRAVRLALAWGMGVQVPEKRLERVAHAAHAAAIAALSTRSDAASSASLASASASLAANAAVDTDGAPDASAAAASATGYAADATRGARWVAERTTHLGCLHSLVTHQTAPAVPTPLDVHRATPNAQVAWDRLVERCPEPVRVGTLGDALARSRKARLRWTCPVERALAERCELAELIELWGGRGG